MILALLLSCTPDAPPDPAVVDAEAYLEATAAADPRQAFAACERITDDSLRRECKVFAAKALAQAGHSADALAICRELTDYAWRQVCAFELVDTQGMMGADAVAACQETGHFQERCLSHALSREEGSISTRFAPGQEAEMMAYIAQRLHDYGLEGVSRENHVEKMTARILAQRMAPQASAGAAISLAMCGTVPEPTCAEAYLTLVQQVDRQGKTPQACSVGADSAQIQALGLPGWSEDFQPVAAEAWSRLCTRDIHKGRRVQ